MIAEVLNNAKSKMDKALEVAKDDFQTVRSGRINPQLFQKVLVDYYGSPTPLAQLASFNVQDARTLVLSPFDKSSMKAIETAIRDDNNLGANPSNDGNVIRVTIPELTEERRKEYVKLVKNKAEDHRVVVRNIRRKAKDELDALKSEIGEDEVARGEKDLEAATKTAIDAIDEALKRKEVELLEV